MSIINSRSLFNSCPLSWWCHPTISTLSSPSPPTFNLSQNQGLFKWVSSLHQVAEVLESQLHHQSFQWIFRVDFFKYKFIYFNWRLITLQYCVGFAIHQHESATGIHRCSPSRTPLPPPSPYHPSGRPSAPAPSNQYHASNLDWWFISYIILYMFQCHSPKSSHPLPLPQSPQRCHKKNKTTGQYHWWT